MVDVDHCVKVFKSSCSLLLSVLLAIGLKIFVSSAKVAIVDEDTASGRSLTYRRKRIGPRIDPRGTPDVTGKEEDVDPRHGGGMIGTS